MERSLNLKARLFKDTLESTWRQVIGGFAGHRYAAGFAWVSKLPVAAAPSNLHPTVIF
jgi:hypothetical protein